jgi:2-polyprenyl-6-methoxyphenol hydroxylase-like FAD-dependent oxidoreductase
MSGVLVVGAGPVGLTMAVELARHGIRCRIVDRLAEPLPHCRAIGVTPRTLEVWEDIGIVRDMIDAGIWITGLRSIIQGQPPRDDFVDLSDLPYGELGLPQYETERLLARHLGGYGVEVERGVTLAGLVQRDEEVAVRLDRAEGEGEHAAFRYVIGCDGAHSAVRHAIGIAFAGEAFPMMFMLGDVHIDWQVPRGIAVRALRLVEDDAPAMFIAIPLPEPGRYRVSTLAPHEVAAPEAADHGIQSQLAGPDLPHIQAIADELVPDRPRLTDLRWSSFFRISMRLAERYRRGRVFLAGDAAHIHPPTGGQGMNTGIQDAYNLAWKLALVLKGAASEALLDSYETERRPVGADVVARTRAASERYGREQGGKPDRLADTQIRVSYRGTPWVLGDRASGGAALPGPGDRAPDAGGLRRNNVGFALRLFDVLRGTQHVLVAHLPTAASGGRAEDVERLVRRLGLSDHLRAVIIAAPGVDIAEQPGVALYRDDERRFAGAYGEGETAYLIRPDGYIGWRGRSCAEPGLTTYLDRIFRAGG